MAAIVPNPKRIKRFGNETAFETWLRADHAREMELWIRIYKKDSSIPTITHLQAIDVAPCWGWIDCLRKAFDERSFLQRFSPRQPRSVWNHINCDIDDTVPSSAVLWSAGTARLSQSWILANRSSLLSQQQRKEIPCL